MRRLRVAGLALCVLCLICGAGLLASYYFGGPLSPRITAARFRSEIETDLPPGTPRDQVEAWFNGRNIPFRYVSVGSVSNSPIGGLDGTIDAQVPFEFLSKTAIYFQVLWDKDGKRTIVQVEERTIGF